MYLADTLVYTVVHLSPKGERTGRRHLADSYGHTDTDTNTLRYNGRRACALRDHFYPGSQIEIYKDKLKLKSDAAAAAAAAAHTKLK